MKRLERWFAAQADVARWELAAWYSVILAAVAFPSVGGIAFFATIAAVLVVLGNTRWDRCPCGLRHDEDEDWWME